MKRPALLLLLAPVLLAAPAEAWWPAGHSLLTKAAVMALPAEMPAFFRAGADQIAHCAQDPDVIKVREARSISNAEYPEHFIDWELLGGRELPPTRYAFLKLCAEAKLDPYDVGLAPYAIAEETERLAIAFAEYRKWPENPFIRAKCLVYAGNLAHYAGDLCMPLHTTIHYDGRVGPDGKSPRSGIHARVDSLPEKLAMQPVALAKDLKVAPLPALFPGILAQVQDSRRLIDRTYELEAKLPPERGDWTPTPEVVAFATERARESARFTASLYLTAWQISATLRLPSYLEREAPAK